MTTAGLFIREATAGDAAKLPEIERSAAKAFLSVSGLEWIAGEDVMSSELQQIYIAAGTVWVATTARRCIGFVTAAKCEDALHILELSVEDGHQGQGVGRRLMAAARQYAAGNNIPALTLTAFRALPFNEHFYHKLGYQTLADEELPQRLSDILKAEIDNGLPGDRRCAMRLIL